MPIVEFLSTYLHSSSCIIPSLGIPGRHTRHMIPEESSMYKEASSSPRTDSKCFQCGFFGDVYRGTWLKRTVAVKVLAAETTPRKIFVHEVEIWKSLYHPNVLELFGASSASGEPPWFLVSKYYPRGSLVKYLRGLSDIDATKVDALKMIHEISNGMEYLHNRGVLHGDLKAPAQALTPEMDLYAFAICCIEILTKGALPWPLMDDDAVRHFVLNENMRPSLPSSNLVNGQLMNVIRASWDTVPSNRPSFKQTARDLKKQRAEYRLADV
ncbi:kinase-like domain-containing protein [Lactarius deliciosus]|nr:kinase-like domain-containing protein [Lactarius deliciosus]